MAAKIISLTHLLETEAHLPRTIQLQLIEYRRRIAELEQERGEFLRSLRRLIPPEEAY